MPRPEDHEPYVSPTDLDRRRPRRRVVSRRRRAASSVAARQRRKRVELQHAVEGTTPAAAPAAPEPLPSGCAAGRPHRRKDARRLRPPSSAHHPQPPDDVPAPRDGAAAACASLLGVGGLPSSSWCTTSSEASRSSPSDSSVGSSLTAPDRWRSGAGDRSARSPTTSIAAVAPAAAGSWRPASLEERVLARRQADPAAVVDRGQHVELPSHDPAVLGQATPSACRSL